MNPDVKYKRVLSVEDDQASQYFMQLILEKIGCRFDLVSNGQEAVDKVRGAKFNVIFMDLRMPVMDGFQATEIIRREIDKTVPIIAISAHTLQEVTEKCSAAGMNAFIPKAYDMDEFEKEVIAWIEKS